MSNISSAAPLVIICVFEVAPLVLLFTTTLIRRLSKSKGISSTFVYLLLRPPSSGFLSCLASAPSIIAKSIKFFKPVW